MPYKKTLILAGGAAAVLACAAWTSDRLIIGDGVHQSTNDAYVTADFTVVAPKVDGRIDQVNVEDNERVEAGQELAHIEDDDFRTVLLVAQANVVTAKADLAHLHAELDRQKSVIAGAQATVSSDDAALVFAKANAARYQKLSEGGAGTIEQKQAAEAQYREAIAARARDVAGAEAADHQIPILLAQLDRANGQLMRMHGEFRQAELNLSYTTVRAPVDGVVGARGVRVGAYVSRGTALMAVVPLRKAYVIAEFQENQLTRVQPGQRADVTVDTFPGRILHAHVDSLAPSTGVAFAPIQPDNATGNFTKVVQRIPVKVVFDSDQTLAERVRVGMSVEVTIDTTSKADGAHASDSRFAWR